MSSLYYHKYRALVTVANLKVTRSSTELKNLVTEFVPSKDFKENLCNYVCEQIIITLRKSDEAQQSATSQKVTVLEVENALLKSEVDELRRQSQEFKNHISIEPEKSNADNKKLESPSLTLIKAHRH